MAGALSRQCAELSLRRRKSEDSELRPPRQLIVARTRPAAAQAKSDKDVQQAAQVIAVLADDCPGDLREAWAALTERRWGRAIAPGLAALAHRHPAAFRALQGEQH